MQTPILKVLNLRTTKFIVHDQAKLDRSAKNIKDWSRENGMELNANKSKLLNVRGKLTTSMCGQEMKPTESQNNLGLIITSNLSWQGNCNHRVQKATSSFPNKTKYDSNQLRVNQNELLYWLYCSNTDVLLTIMVAKLHQYVQIMATKWILGNSLQSYKERLISLKLFPLCHCLTAWSSSLPSYYT